MKERLMMLTGKPFIKWVGGKGQLIPTFKTLLPAQLKHREAFTYVEPFVGGGAMLFFMLRTFPNIQKAVVNDVNPNLTKAYTTVKGEPEALIGRLSALQDDYLRISGDEGRKELYLAMRRKFNAGHLTDIENTALLIFLNKTCFNGLYRVNSRGEFNVPSGRYKNPAICDADTIRADSRLLQKVEILNGDFEKTEPYASRGAFVYLDPPYRPLDATSSFTSYASSGFNDTDQLRLKAYFDRLSSKGCLLMLSNSDCKARNPEDAFFDDLYGDYAIKRVYATRAVNSNAGRRGKIPELLIRNYTTDTASATTQPELQFQDYDHGQSAYH